VSTPTPSPTTPANVGAAASAAPNNTIAIIGVAGGVSIAALLAIAAVAAAFRQRGGRKRSLSSSPDTFTRMPGAHPNFINVVHHQDPNEYMVAAANPSLSTRNFALPPAAPPTEKVQYNPFQARASPMSAAPPPIEEMSRQSFAPQQAARALPSAAFMNSARKITKFALPPPPTPPPPADDESQLPPYP
jgi:hypothetical protein